MSDQESHKYRYRLVEFLGEFTDGKKIIEIVADGWVRKRETMKDLCDYRPKKDWPKLEQWLQEERPFQNSWNIYEIEILGRAATFEKAKKKLERLYKTRSDVETHSEVDSAYGLDITRKRAASMLKTSYSLEDIEEESIVSPKRSRKDADSLSDRTQAPSVLQSDIRSMHPVEATNNATNQMHPKTHCEDRLQQLRKQNQNDPVKSKFSKFCLRKLKDQELLVRPETPRVTEEPEEDPNRNQQDAEDWLTTHVGPPDTVKDFWTIARPIRRRLLQDNITVPEYFQRFPALKAALGAELLSRDFSVPYPAGGRNFRDRWNIGKAVITEALTDCSRLKGEDPSYYRALPALPEHNNHSVILY
ncbi:uncharacterized protein [Fopius arisanus]|uniref:Uncharacterized protein n=1 Tax=Fopius arisanus TaxID=64838 RepID=A0A9R1SZ09_9HYME|nr:PREDICTED: uncharacterized protein LOC105264521 [Fopius arisanus]